MAKQDLTIAKKKEWAKLLFTKENCSQLEIAERVGVHKTTLCKWIEEGNWRKLKVSISMTREQQLKQLYSQLENINNEIATRPEKNYPSSAEGDIITKIVNAIDKMESDIGIKNIVSVSQALVAWVRDFDLVKAQEVGLLLDSFLKDKLR